MGWLSSRRASDRLLALLAFAAAPAAIFFLTNRADPDLWGHLLAGRLMVATRDAPRVDPFSFSASGAPWVDHEWGFEALVFASFKAFGSFGLVLLRAFATAATLELVRRLIARQARSLSTRITLFLLTAFVVMSLGRACRPQLFTYLGCAWLLLSPSPWLLVPWSWLHGGFLAGGGILLAMSMAGRADRRLLRNTVLALAATALNPYGFGLWASLWRALNFAPLRSSVTEWQPVWSTSVPGYRACVFFYALALSAAWLSREKDARRREIRSWIVAAAGLAASAASVRHLPLLAIMAAGPLAGALEGLRARHYAGGSSPRRERGAFFLCFNGVLIGLLGVILIWVLFWNPASERLPLGALPAQTADELALGPRPGVVIYPRGAARFIKVNALSGSLMNPIESGGYLIWHLYPQCRVFIDTRMDKVYGEGLFRDYMTLFFSRPGWEAVLSRYDPDLVLLSAGDLSLPLRLTGQGWGLIYRDPDYVLMARVRGRFARLSREYAQDPTLTPRSALPWLFP